MTFHELGLGIIPIMSFADYLTIALIPFCAWMLHRKWKYNLSWLEVLRS
jgi:hypothetical protein